MSYFSPPYLLKMICCLFLENTQAKTKQPTKPQYLTEVHHIIAKFALA